MDNKTFKRSANWILFLISPAICFFSSIVEFRKGIFRNLILVPFIMAFFAYLHPLFSDLARNISVAISQLSFNNETFFALNVDFFLPGLLRLFLIYEWPLEWVRFGYTFLVYFLMYKIIRRCFEFNFFTTHSLYLLFVLLFLYIPFFDLVINTRTTLASFILLYVMFEVYAFGNKKALGWLLFLPIVHFSCIPVIVMFLVNYCIKPKQINKVKKPLILFMVFMMFMSDADFITSFLTKIPLGEALMTKIQIYTEGEWSANGTAKTSMETTNYLIYSFIGHLPIIYMLWRYFKSDKTYSADTFIIGMSALLFFSLPIPVLFGRLLSYLNVALIFRLIVEYKDSICNVSPIKNSIKLYMLVTICTIYANYNCLVNGNMWYIVTPIPFEIVQTYDFDNWCHSRLTEDFNTFTNKSWLSR